MEDGNKFQNNYKMFTRLIKIVSNEDKYGYIN